MPISNALSVEVKPRTTLTEFGTWGWKYINRSIAEVNVLVWETQVGINGTYKYNHFKSNDSSKDNHFAPFKLLENTVTEFWIFTNGIKVYKLLPMVSRFKVPFVNLQKIKTYVYKILLQSVQCINNKGVFYLLIALQWTLSASYVVFSWYTWWKRVRRQTSRWFIWW